MIASLLALSVFVDLQTLRVRESLRQVRVDLPVRVPQAVQPRVLTGGAAARAKREARQATMLASWTARGVA